MTWTTSIIDVMSIENSNQYYLLVGASRGDHFTASTVLRIDLEHTRLVAEVEVPLNPFPWVSIKALPTGQGLILTGAQSMHHLWNGKRLIENPIESSFQSGYMWSANAETVFYCAGNKLFRIGRSDSEVETVETQSSLNCIHGVFPHLRVVGGNAGKLLIFKNSHWVEVENFPSKNAIVDIYCKSTTEIYISAGYAGVFLWDGGTKWIHYDTEPGVYAYRFCQYHENTYVTSLQVKSYILKKSQAILLDSSRCALKFVPLGKKLFGLGLGKFEVFDGNIWQIFDFDLYQLFPTELDALWAQSEGP